MNEIRMADVSAKPITRRRARARGTLHLSAEARRMALDGRLPKGDALALAQAAGIQGAKRAADWLPLCHPLPLDHVEVEIAPGPGPTTIEVRCTATAEARTGVEMEALAGASAALLCLYDTIKPVDPALVLGDIRLDFKEGGKGGMWTHPLARPESDSPRQRPSLAGTRAAVIVVSDRAAGGVVQDGSGPVAESALKELGAVLLDKVIVPDDMDAIRRVVHESIARGAELVVSSGGTGVAPRDVTIAALDGIASKRLHGLGEKLRLDGSLHTPMAWLSESAAFVVEGRLVVALPGSPKAVSEGLASLAELLPHALHVLKGGGHKSAEAGA